MAETASDKWSGRTDGTPWMQRALIGAGKVLPLWMPYSLMSFVALGYMVAHKKERSAIYRYFRRRHGFGRLKSAWYTYRNHVTFGAIILDRFMLFAGKKYRIDVEGYDTYLSLNDAPGGFVIFSSHTGNYEMAGYSLVSRNKSFHALVYGGETETVMRNRERVFDHNNIHMIKTSPDMTHLFEINNALAAGNIVSLPADRLFGSTKSARCMLLGAEANIPLGPFMVASQRDVPAVAVFVNKTGMKRYVARVVRIDTLVDKSLPTRRRATAMADAFAREMEKVVRKHPAQWFNYFDYWNDADDDTNSQQ